MEYNFPVILYKKIDYTHPGGCYLSIIHVSDAEVLPLSLCAFDLSVIFFLHGF